MNCNAVKELHCFHLYVTKLNPAMNYSTLFFIGMIALYQVKADLVSNYHIYCKHKLHRSQLSSTDLVESKMENMEREFIFMGYLKLLYFSLFCLYLFSTFKSLCTYTK